MSEILETNAREEQVGSKMEIELSSKMIVSSDDDEMQESRDINNDGESVSSADKIMQEVEELQKEAAEGPIESTTMPEATDTTAAAETNVLDLQKLFQLLEASKSASHQIAGKNVLLLIGGTGAGKTTTCLYLAGAKFEEVEIGGRDHFEPVVPLPKPELEDFIVSGSVQSVTKTIHAVPITLPDGSSFTLCDTPGFGDSAGAEMDISNGLGIIHALQQAASVTPVLVLNYKNWDFNRYQGLREILGTVERMMGSNIDFSSFGYAFTNCEGRGKKRVHKQLAAFMEGSHLENATLAALVKDMIEKAKPEAMAIDPMDHQAVPEVLEDLLANRSSSNPKENFVPFVSEQSKSKLKEQIQVMSERMRQRLEVGNLEVAFDILGKLQNLNLALCQGETHEAFEKGKTFLSEWLHNSQTSANQLAERMVASHCVLKFKKLGQELRAIMDRLVDASKCNIPSSALDFNPVALEEFVEIVAKSLFKSNQSIPVDTPVRDKAVLFQMAIERHHYLCSFVFKEVLDEKLQQGKTALLSRFIFGTIDAELNLVKSAIECDEEHEANDEPNSITWADIKDSLVFILEMHQYFESSDILREAGMDVEGPFMWPTDEVQALISSLISKAKVAMQRLASATKSMEDLIKQKDSWSWKTSFPLWDQEIVDDRELLLVLSSETVFRENLQSDEVIGGSFDQELCDAYLPEISSFIEDRAKDLSKNIEYSDSAKLQLVLDEASGLFKVAEQTIQMCLLFWDVNATHLNSAKDVLSRTQERLKCIIEDVSNTAKQHSRPPKQGGNAIKASDDEIRELKSTKNGAIWYNKYLELVKYQRKNGHCNVPQSMKPLGTWVHNQRTAYNSGKLPDIRETVLEKLGFLFDASQVFIVHEQEKWLENCKKLASFQKREGRFPPQNSGSLGKWLCYQRNTIKKWRKTGKYLRGQHPESMVEERFEKLNSIGALN